MIHGAPQGKKNDEGVDLFSFLNIMAATIGVQSLLIVICALQIKPGVQAIQLLPAGEKEKAKKRITSFVRAAARSR